LSSLCSSSSSNKTPCCCWCFTSTLSSCIMITDSIRGLSDGEVWALCPACWILHTSSYNFCKK
jgi:hypothetical protein